MNIVGCQLPAQLPGLCFLLEAVLPTLVCDWSEGSATLCRSAACCSCSASSCSGNGACMRAHNSMAPAAFLFRSRPPECYTERTACLPFTCAKHK